MGHTRSISFVASSALVIEVDGGQHAQSSQDMVRDRWLEEHNFRVLQFWNHDVLRNISHGGAPSQNDEEKMTRSALPGLAIATAVLIAGLLLAFTVGRYPVSLGDLASVLFAKADRRRSRMCRRRCRA